MMAATATFISLQPPLSAQSALYVSSRPNASGSATTLRRRGGTSRNLDLPESRDVIGVLGVQLIPEIHTLLEVQPKLGRCPENTCKTERRVRRNAALSVRDLAQACTRYTDPFGEIGQRDAEGVEVLTNEDFARGR